MEKKKTNDQNEIKCHLFSSQTNGYKTAKKSLLFLFCAYLSTGLIVLATLCSTCYSYIVEKINDYSYLTLSFSPFAVWSWKITLIIGRTFHTIYFLYPPVLFRIPTFASTLECRTEVLVNNSSMTLATR